ncbi:MAG: hypothetical protein J2P22_11195, partial [Nocardioides sp.]|nr:hypothetical protein [Nocardioides sp.]
MHPPKPCRLHLVVLLRHLRVRGGCLAREKHVGVGRQTTAAHPMDRLAPEEMTARSEVAELNVPAPDPG